MLPVLQIFRNLNPQQKTMSDKAKLLSFFLFVFLIIGCRNEQSGDLASLPPPEINILQRYYTALLDSLRSLHLDPMFHDATLGYLIVDVTSADPLIVADHHSQQPMIPASTLKIFVTGAALEYFGKSVVPEVNVTNMMSVNWRSSKLLRKIGAKVYNKSTKIGRAHV